MIELYTAQSSNGQRAAIALEECGLPYRVHKLDLMKGEQRTPEFLKLNPGRRDSGHRRPGGPRRRADHAGAVRAPSRSTPPRRRASSCRGTPARRALALQWLHVRRHRLRIGVDAGLLRIGAAPGEAAGQSRLLRGTAREVSSAWPMRGSPDREWLADEVSIADFALYPICAVRKGYIDKRRRPAESHAVDGDDFGAAGGRDGNARDRLTATCPKGGVTRAPKENGRREIRHRPPHCAPSAQSYFR